MDPDPFNPGGTEEDPERNKRRLFTQDYRGRGIVCGLRRRFVGQYEVGETVIKADGEWEEVAPRLYTTGSVILYEVREGMLNRPIEVAPEDLEVDQQFLSFPFFHALPPIIDAGYRQQLSEEAKAAPRDSRGRFVPRLGATLEVDI